MSMANREESDLVTHDTFPGPGALRSDEGRTNIRPVEQMVDAAIDRIEREYAAAKGVKPGESLAVAPQEGMGIARRKSGRLRWRGLDVSEEFRSYAERVARGEDLPPFTGKILAEPDAVFPWGPGQSAPASPRPALRQQLGLWGGALLLLGGVAWSIFGALHTLDNDPLRHGESPLGTAMLANRASTDSIDPSKALEGVSRTAAPRDEVVAGSDSLGTTAPSAALASSDKAEQARRALPLADKPAGALQAPKANAALAPVIKPNLAPAVVPNSASHGAVALSPPGVPANAVAHEQRSALEIPHLAIPSAAIPSAAVPSAAVPSAAVPSTAAAPAPSAGIGGNVNASNSPGALAQSDPKKEPTREASGMGALLVETPSF